MEEKASPVGTYRVPKNFDKTTMQEMMQKMMGDMCLRVAQHARGDLANQKWFCYHRQKNRALFKISLLPKDASHLMIFRVLDRPPAYSSSSAFTAATTFWAISSGTIS